jgi:hypothetical protein
VGKYGLDFVHQNFSVVDDSKRNVDFVVFLENKILGFEMFYPKHKSSFFGCLNYKEKKEQTLFDRSLFFPNRPIEFHYVVLNRDMGQSTIDDFLSKKKIKTSRSVLSLENFENKFL